MHVSTTSSDLREDKEREYSKVSELRTAGSAEPEERLRLSSPKTHFLVVALLLLTISTALRVYHLGDRSFGYDEAVVANASRGTFTQMLDVTRTFSAPIVHPYIL